MNRKWIRIAASIVLTAWVAVAVGCGGGGGGGGTSGGGGTTTDNGTLSGTAK